MSLATLAGSGPRASSAGDKNDRGGSAVEYGLLVSGIAALIAVIVFAFGDNIADLFDGTCDEVASQGVGTAC